MGATGPEKYALGSWFRLLGCPRQIREKNQRHCIVSTWRLGACERGAGITNDMLQVIFHMWVARLKRPSVAWCGSVSGCTHRGATETPLKPSQTCQQDQRAPGGDLDREGRLLALSNPKVVYSSIILTLLFSHESRVLLSQ